VTRPGLDPDLGVRAALEHRADGFDLLARDVGIGPAEVEQDRAGDPIGQVEHRGDPRAVVRDGDVGIARRGEQIGERPTQAVAHHPCAPVELAERSDGCERGEEVADLRLLGDLGRVAPGDAEGPLQACLVMRPGETGLDPPEHVGSEHDVAERSIGSLACTSMSEGRLKGCLPERPDTPTNLSWPMFDTLTDRFDGILSRLRSRGRLGDAEVNEVLREIRVALLEADVNLAVVRDLVERIRARCSGAELSKSLTPAQQVIKVVNEELTSTLGGEAFKLAYASRPPTVVLLAGLQGAGKTTTAAKLARWFKQQGRHPLLVAADLQRPAAVEQLRILGKEVGVPVFSEPTDPVEVARKGLEEAERLGRDVLVVDTAGRLSIDLALMAEVRSISAALHPHYTFLVIDAMTGQDAVNTAKAFNDTLALDGVVLTKVDGDARGGAALSVKQVVGKPIAYVSTGERVADFDTFHPDRLASRILGMGDVLSLIEKAEREYDAGVAEKAVERLQEGRFTLEDFLEQLQQVKRMGPLQGMLGMFPGVPKEMRDAKIDDKDVGRIEAIIRSMTPAERREPDLLNGSRRLRIANGSGTSTTEVNNLVKQFREMQKLMRSLGPMANLGRAKAKKASRNNKKVKGGRVTPSTRGAR
jgi:signal recognition particle subunit SRP54